MSFYTEGARGDLASERTMIINKNDKDSRGHSRFQVLPWEIVDYGSLSNGGDRVGGLEPVNTLPAEGIAAGSLEVPDSDRHPTDVLYVDTDSFVIYSDGTPVSGGDIGIPRR